MREEDRKPSFSCTPIGVWQGHRVPNLIHQLELKRRNFGSGIAKNDLENIRREVISMMCHLCILRDT